MQTVLTRGICSVLAEAWRFFELRSVSAKKVVNSHHLKHIAWALPLRDCLPDTGEPVASAGMRPPRPRAIKVTCPRGKPHTRSSIATVTIGECLYCCGQQYICRRAHVWKQPEYATRSSGGLTCIVLNRRIRAHRDARFDFSATNRKGERRTP